MLLEIGLWRTSCDMIKGVEDQTPVAVLADISKKRVPHLMYSMGDGYHNAVRDCLSEEGGFDVSMDSDCETEDIIRMHLGFERQVIEPLSSCSA